MTDPPIKSILTISPEAAAAFERKVNAAPLVACDGSIYSVKRVGMLGAAASQSLGAFPFPCRVEFNTVAGRATADLL